MLYFLRLLHILPNKNAYQGDPTGLYSIQEGHTSGSPYSVVPGD